MSFAQLQQQFAPLHAALTNDSYTPALSACDELLTQLQALRSQLQATPSSSPTTASSSASPSLAAQSKQLLASLTNVKQTHTRNFKVLHSRTQAFGSQLDGIQQLDTSRLHFQHFDERHVDSVVMDAMAREGWVEAAREMRREVAEVRQADASAEEERSQKGEGEVEAEAARWEREERLEQAMTQMHDIRRSLQQQREVGPCLEWVKAEEARAKQRVEALRVEKLREDEDKKRKRAAGRAAADSGGDGSRIVDDEDSEERVGLALDMFASHIASPPPEAQQTASSLTAVAPPSQPPPSMAVLLAEAESVHKQLHALHFDLHQIRFLQLLTSSPPAAPPSATSAAADMSDSITPLSSLSSGSGQRALLYAQTHFTPFASDRIDDIRKLSGLLLFYPNLTASPFGNILTPPTSPTAASSHHDSPVTPSALSSLLASVASTFTALYLRLHNLPTHSPLLTLLEASSLAYPQLIHYQSLPLSSSSTSLELELGSHFPFHSTFICPVTREPNAPGNEPVMLPCGHLISATAMDKIVRGQRSMSRKFKCPTCPREQTAQEVIHVQL